MMYVVKVNKVYILQKEVSSSMLLFVYNKYSNKPSLPSFPMVLFWSYFIITPQLAPTGCGDPFLSG